MTLPKISSLVWVGFCLPGSEDDAPQDLEFWFGSGSSSGDDAPQDLEQPADAVLHLALVDDLEEACCIARRMNGAP